ncbi:hypothetical protein GCM10010266_57810 [Streptomyces griseomycini]|uniref:hypothetical protein n=1 Tax=Streptomyces griseomycini TaxID=66895 RepID=UPI001875D805|nr:hypothetical protein [Streptomyces griseomycini]GGQ26999.1 hypothetical protein GCM10010266_57810 [Streptomyces griseomycini]
MDDANDSDPEHGGIDNVSLYMEILRARMDPGQYDVLARAVRETAHLIAEGHQAGPVGERSAFTPEMRREYATVLAILLTGRMDHQVVEMPGPDGRPGFAIVEASAAKDPARLRGIRESFHRWAGERQAVDEELDGIARASGLSSDD